MRKTIGQVGAGTGADTGTGAGTGAGLDMQERDGDEGKRKIRMQGKLHPDCMVFSLG